MSRGAMRGYATGLIAALALAGCTTVGPNYRLPDKAAARAPVAQAPFREGGALAEATPLPPRWWHLYDDPVLDGLEEQALAANTDLRGAAANLARARAVTSIVEGAKEPDFSAQFGVQHARLSGESYLLPDSLPVANLGSGGIEMSYQIDLFGRIRRSVEAARAQEEAVAATRDAVQVTVAADVARAYIGVCSAQEALDITTAALALQQRTLDINQRLTRAGRGAVGDVTQAEARVDLARSALPIHRAHARAALYRLAFLLGRAPADYPRAAEACRHVPVLAGALPVGDGAALLRRRPDLRAAERQLAAATARIGVATADLYPQIGIGLSSGSTGFLADLGQAATNSWSIGSLIHWTFPGAGARGRVKAAGAEADGALAHFDGAVLGALRETETALAAMAQDRDRVVALDAARRGADTAADEARRLRAGGKSPALADIGAQQGAIVARAAEQAARAELASDQITLFLALGGGW
jgi:NodT family efflux transporter outer membrane factor (OMF) lipoprotein